MYFSLRGFVIGIATLGAAIAAAIFSAAASLDKADPVQALMLNPRDPVARLFAADQLLQQPGASIDAAKLRQAGMDVLRSAPLDPGGLRLLAGAAEARGDEPGAYRLMALAEHVSRREVGAQLWMIEERVRAGDARGALRHYDLALTTSDTASGLLFPVLSAAISDSGIRAALLSLVTRGRPWMADFLTYAATTGAQPDRVAELLTAAGSSASRPEYQALRPQVLRQLIARNQFDSANRYALTLIPPSSPVLRDAGFSSGTMDPGLAPLTWQLNDTADAHVVVAGDGSIEAVMAPNTRQVVATRVLFLPPGRYDFASTVMPSAGLGPAEGVWELYCLATSPGLAWSQTLKGATPGRFEASFTLDRPCTTQQLTFTVTGDDSQSDSTIKVGQVRLTPTGLR